MASNRDTFTSEIYVNNEQANNAIAEMTKQVTKLTDKYDDLAARNEKLAEKTAKAKAAMEETSKALEGMAKNTEEYAKTSKKLDEQKKAYNDLAKKLEISKHKTADAKQEMDSMKASLDRANEGVEEFGKALKNLSGRSMENLLRMQKQLKAEMDKAKPNTPEWDELAKKYQDVTNRIKTLSTMQQGLTTGTGKLSGSMGGLLGKLGNIGSMITAIPTVLKGVRIGIKAIVEVTKQTIQASQTMGDKWNNAMDAMKTTTNAFFAALSTGDWSAFNDGLAAALKKARELAELKDLLGSFEIAGGYMQAKYRVDFTSQMSEATNTENDAATRKAALDAAKSDLEAQREFTEREADATFKTLQAMFESWKGITFKSQDEFEDFFDELFRTVTTGGNETFEEAKSYINGLVAEMTELHVEGDLIYSDYTKGEAVTIALEKATEKYGEKMVGLYRAAELSDEKQKELIQTYGKWRGDLQRIDQDEKSYNRTRDRVIKQIGEQGDTIEEVMAFIDEWVEQEKQAAKERYEANKASFDSIKDAAHEYADEMAQIEAEGEAKREAARAKAEEERRKAEEKARQERQAAADKAYQAAMKRVEKQESAQKLVWKNQYAAGLIDKQTYEAQIAVVEEDFLKQRLATAERYGKDTDQYMSQLLDRQIARMEKAKAMLKEEADEMAKYYEGLRTGDEGRYLDKDGKPKQADNGVADQEAYNAFQEKLAQKAANIRAAITEDSARTEYETQMKWAEKLADDGKLTAEEAEKYKLKIKLKYAQQAAQQVNSITEQASNFVSALKDAELAKAEANYQAQLTAAGDNAERRKEIEAEYEEKKLDLQKKYADAEMAISIAKTVANGAAAAVKAIADSGWIAGGIIAGLIAATTAAEVATIVQQRNAIKNTSVNSSSSSSATTVTDTDVGKRTITDTSVGGGYASGGFTPTAASDTKPVGVVHANEYVVPAWMVRRNPVMIANLERYRQTGPTGAFPVGGFANGGLAGGGGSVQAMYGEDLYNAAKRGAKQGTLEGVTKALEDFDWKAVEDFTKTLGDAVNYGIPAFILYNYYEFFKARQERLSKQTSR